MNEQKEQETKSDVEPINDKVVGLITKTLSRGVALAFGENMYNRGAFEYITTSVGGEKDLLGDPVLQIHVFFPYTLGFQQEFPEGRLMEVRNLPTPIRDMVRRKIATLNNERN